MRLPDDAHRADGDDLVACAHSSPVVSQSSATHSSRAAAVEHEGGSRVAPGGRAASRAAARRASAAVTVAHRSASRWKRWRSSTLKRLTTASASLSRSRSRLLRRSTSTPPVTGRPGVELGQARPSACSPMRKCRLSTRSVAQVGVAARPPPPARRCAPAVPVAATRCASARLRTPCTSGKMPAFFRSSVAAPRRPGRSSRFHQPPRGSPKASIAAAKRASRRRCR